MEISLKKFRDSSQQSELKVLLSDARNTLSEDSEPLLFAEPFRAVALEYLSHHALKEKNQHLLFLKDNKAFLEFYIERWSLGSDWEKKLFLVPYRSYLSAYMQRGMLVDSQNELLLFEKIGLSCFRRFYIKHYPLHCRDAEAQLFEPEYADDLALYIGAKHHLFPEFVEILAAYYPQLYQEYCRYCPPQS